MADFLYGDGGWQVSHRCMFYICTKTNNHNHNMFIMLIICHVYNQNEKTSIKQSIKEILNRMKYKALSDNTRVLCPSLQCQPFHTYTRPCSSSEALASLYHGRIAFSSCENSFLLMPRMCDDLIKCLFRFPTWIVKQGRLQYENNHKSHLNYST